MLYSLRFFFFKMQFVS